MALWDETNNVYVLLFYGKAKAAECYLELLTKTFSQVKPLLVSNIEQLSPLDAKTICFSAYYHEKSLLRALEQTKKNFK